MFDVGVTVDPIDMSMVDPGLKSGEEGGLRVSSRLPALETRSLSPAMVNANLYTLRPRQSRWGIGELLVISSGDGWMNQ